MKPELLSWHHLDDFTRGYLEAALWSSTYDDGECPDRPMDDDFGPEDIHPDTLRGMVEDCKAFQEGEAYTSALEAGHIHDLERAGMDFWLTRNRHGAGFWDGDYPADVGAALTAVSRPYGEFSLYIGDDDMVHGA